VLISAGFPVVQHFLAALVDATTEALRDVLTPMWVILSDSGGQA
jgi:hypothetical protein